MTKIRAPFLLLPILGSLAAAPARAHPFQDLVPDDLVLGDLVLDDLVLGDLVPGDLVPGEVFLQIEADAVPAGSLESVLAAVLGDAGLEPSFRPTFLPVPPGRRDAVGLARIATARVPRGREPELAETLAADPRVAWAEPNRRVGGPGAVDVFVPDDPQFAAQWALDQANDVDMDVSEAWALRGSFQAAPEVVVAVVDTGYPFSPMTEDLQRALWTNPNELANGIDDDGNGLVDDLHGWDFAENDAEPDAGDPHGAWVASILAGGTNDGGGIAGIASGARLMPVKVFDDSGQFPTSGPWQGLASAAAGIQYAVDQGADVINNSWWIGTVPSSVINAAVAYAADNGVAVVGIAGNFGTTSSWPAQHQDAIAAAAIDAQAKRSVWCSVTPCKSSGYGAWVDLCAAGTRVLAAEPGGGAVFLNGTSVAAPQVSGVIALLWSENPDLPLADVRAILAAGAVDVDPSNPGFEGKLGAGHVNALASLQMVAPFESAGSGVPAGDAPILTGWGGTGAGGELTLLLANAPASTSGVLLAGSGPDPRLAAHGLVVPSPVFALPISTSPDGTARLVSVLAAPLPAGPSLWLQAAFPLPTGRLGWTLSTCLTVSGI